MRVISLCEYTPEAAVFDSDCGLCRTMPKMMHGEAVIFRRTPHLEEDRCTWELLGEV